MEWTAAPADAVFRFVPADQFPDGPPVVFLDVDGHPCWLIREGADIAEVVVELNVLGTHVVRHGLWIPQPEDEQKPPPFRLRHVS